MGGEALHSCVLPHEAFIFIFIFIVIVIIRQAAHLQLGNCNLKG